MGGTFVESRLLLSIWLLPRLREPGLCGWDGGGAPMSILLLLLKAGLGLRKESGFAGEQLTRSGGAVGRAAGETPCLQTSATH